MNNVKSTDIFLSDNFKGEVDKVAILLSELQSTIRQLENFNIKIEVSISYKDDDPLKLKDFVPKSENQ